MIKLNHFLCKNKHLNTKTRTHSPVTTMALRHSQYKNTREQCEEIQELKNKILSIECQLTEHVKKNGPRPGEQFFFQVHASPLQKFHNQIAELRSKIYSIEQEPRRQVREREAREREALSRTPEFKIRQIKAQQDLCDGLRNGGFDRRMMHSENQRLAQLKGNLELERAKEKLAGMTEEEKESLYERTQNEKREQKRRRERDDALLKVLR